MRESVDAASRAAEGGNRMSIYIPGMEMPKTCFNCALSHRVQHDITLECLATPHKYRIDFQTAETCRCAEICPLVPVPDHGRLIDADALKKNAYPFPCAIGTEWATTLRQINEAPTVIPASGGKENE